MIIAMQTHGRLQHLATGILSLGAYEDGDGVRQFEDKLVKMEKPRYVRDADLHLFWGYRAYLDAKVPEGVPVVVADKGFLRRPSIMFGLGGDWGACARWPRLPERRIEVPEWQWTNSRVALLLGQDPKDFSARQDCDNFNKWKFETTETLQANGWEVRFREHPRNLLHAPVNVERPQPLDDDLYGVGLVAGLNSGALVECFLKGYPVYAGGAHSFVKGFSVDLAKPDQGEPEGREAFFRWMAGQCWTYAECADGRAWEAIREQVMDPTDPEASEPHEEGQGRARRARSARKA